MPSYGFNVVITAELQARPMIGTPAGVAVPLFPLPKFDEVFSYSINQLGKDGLRSIVHRTHADAVRRSSSRIVLIVVTF